MIILTQFAFGMSLSIDHVQVQGITKISPEDIAEAHQLGYTIKLLGIAEEIDDRIAVSVGPVLVSDQHPLATVQNENNAVMVTGTAVGNTMLIIVTCFMKLVLLVGFQFYGRLIIVSPLTGFNGSWESSTGPLITS
ncbi:hypothetical protein WP50_13155 [Lactiplantibacillus plantarum]|nr:hypothetical protein WP50_13155 [Lactiplantibacillus plantarum]